VLPTRKLTAPNPRFGAVFLVFGLDRHPHTSPDFYHTCQPTTIDNLSTRFTLSVFGVSKCSRANDSSRLSMCRSPVGASLNSSGVKKCSTSAPSFQALFLSQSYSSLAVPSASRCIVASPGTLRVPILRSFDDMGLRPWFQSGKV